MTSRACSGSIAIGVFELSDEDVFEMRGALDLDDDCIGDDQIRDVVANLNAFVFELDEALAQPIIRSVTA